MFDSVKVSSRQTVTASPPPTHGGGGMKLLSTKPYKKSIVEATIPFPTSLEDCHSLT